MQLHALNKIWYEAPRNERPFSQVAVGWAKNSGSLRRGQFAAIEGEPRLNETVVVFRLSNISVSMAVKLKRANEIVPKGSLQW